MALTFSQLPQSGSCVGYWLLDEASASSSYVDQSPNALTLSAGANLTQGTGHEGGVDKCVVFADAADNYLQKTDAAALDITGALTLAGWARGDNFSTADNSPIIGKGTASAAATSYYLWVTDPGGPVFRLQGRVSSDGSTITTVTGATTSLANATWYHLVMVYVPSTSLTIYVNGVQEAQNTTSIPASLFNSASSFRLHNQEDNTNEHPGSMDEWGLWSTNLSATEILRLYNETTPGGFLGTFI